MGAPLQGIRVFDVTHAVAGPWASMLLGSLGADVTKVESPGGDLLRLLSPKHRGLSIPYIHCNLNKRCIVLDLKSPSDRQAAHELIASADVFMENMRPGVVERLGLGYAEVSRVNPRIIYASLPGWGRTGPLANMGANDLLIQAFSGWASITGAPNLKGEICRYIAHLDITASSFLVGAILQALLIRDQTSKGLRVEVTLLGTALNAQLSRIAEFFATGETPPRLGNATSTTAPHQAFLCQDRKWLAVGVVNEHQWAGLCRALGLEYLRENPRFATNALRVQHRQELVPLLEHVFSTRPAAWWSIRLTREAVPHGPFLDFDSLRQHPQVQENRHIVSLHVPQHGSMLFGGLPWRFQRATPQLKARALPHLDRPSGAALEGLRKRWKEIAQTSHRRGEPSINEPKSILEGITVIDITQGLCGPFASQLLADTGAHVVKVEPLTGDFARHFGPPFAAGESVVFLALNRNKRSIALDTQSSDGRKVLLRLLRRADVFLQDLGPRRAEMLGLGYGRLAQRNPRLIYGAVTPFGDHGPLRDRPGTELVVQAMSDYWGSLGAIGESPERLGADIANLNTAIFLFDAILASLYRRRRTGRGDRVTVSMLGTLLHMRGIMWSVHSDPDEWLGNYSDTYTNPRDHGWQTNDRPIYFNLGRGDEQSWVSLLSDLNMTHVLEDDRFALDGGRQAVGLGPFAQDVKPIWESALKNKSAAEAIQLLLRHGANAVPVNDYESLLAHPQTGCLGIVKEMKHPKAGTVRTLVPPWKLGERSPDVGNPPPLLGQHTRQILVAAGYSEKDIRELDKTGVVELPKKGLTSPAAGIRHGREA